MPKNTTKLKQYFPMIREREDIKQEIRENPKLLEKYREWDEEQVFLVVIGVEFLKMLCRPTADNVLETIIFLVARHMIVVTTTTPLDDLISTISIVLLCFVRRYLKEHRMKDKMREEDWRRLEESDESGTAE